jgi:hypothetical protein
VIDLFVIDDPHAVVESKTNETLVWRPRLRVTEEEASMLLSGFWSTTDLMAIFVAVLGYERARQAWRFWLDAPVNWDSGDATFETFVSCFEVKP